MPGSSYHLQTYPHATPFLDQIRPLLEAEEALNGLMLGLALRVESEPHHFGDADPYFSTVEWEGDVIAAALMTPPHGVILYCTQDADGAGVTAAVGAIAQDLHAASWAVPTVNAPSAVSKQFAERWSAITGAAYQLAMETRVFTLRQVVHPCYSAGHLRLVTEVDQELAVQWFRAFTIEAEHKTEIDMVQLHKSVGHKIADRHLFFWEDGEPVSMLGLTRPTAHGIAIGPVYTPPEQRGRGYASSAVARLSQEMLDAGKEFCALFTDQANPTSNHIYQAIGYRALGEFAMYRFA